MDDEIAAAVGDPARWRLVDLLADRPRTVGELAQLTGLRQPQTTKHLQTLARHGIVSVHPLGQRRVYALNDGPLSALADRLAEFAGRAAAHQGDRDVIARYQAAIEAETARADQNSWADGRSFSFERTLPGSPATVWRYWTEPELLASWWAPPSMTVSEVVIEPRAGGRAVLEYQDAEGRYRSTGQVYSAGEPVGLEFDLTVLAPDGSPSFTSRYTASFAESADSTTDLRLTVTLSRTTVDAAPYIAGIETGWGQVLDNLEARLIAAYPKGRRTRRPHKHSTRKALS
jgi:uncharacterized protein YndB with AHSA1/START domain/DNA-binding transcriptional ArsR family regulator